MSFIFSLDNTSLPVNPTDADRSAARLQLWYILYHYGCCFAKVINRCLVVTLVECVTSPAANLGTVATYGRYRPAGGQVLDRLTNESIPVSSVRLITNLKYSSFGANYI